MRAPQRPQPRLASPARVAFRAGACRRAARRGSGRACARRHARADGVRLADPPGGAARRRASTPHAGRVHPAGHARVSTVVGAGGREWHTPVAGAAGDGQGVGRSKKEKKRKRRGRRSRQRRPTPPAACWLGRISRRHGWCGGAHPPSPSNDGGGGGGRGGRGGAVAPSRSVDALNTNREKKETRSNEKPCGGTRTITRGAFKGTRARARRAVASRGAAPRSGTARAATPLLPSQTHTARPPTRDKQPKQKKAPLRTAPNTRA